MLRRAMVLAAGFGTRLRPLTGLLPKALMPVANQPLISFLLRLLGRHGLEQVAINLHHLPQAIVEALGEGSRWGVKITYSWEEPILGTGGGLVRMRDFLSAEGPFLVINGDILLAPDLARFFEFHRESGAVATMMVRELPAGSGYTSLGLDEGGRIVRFKSVEVRSKGRIKPVMFCGIHLMQPDVFDFLPRSGFSCVNDTAYPAMLKAGLPVMGWLYNGPWLDIGTLAGYLAANLDLVSGRVDLSALDPWRGSELRGTVLWGCEASAAAGARVGPEVVLGPRVRVAAGVSVAQSVVWPDCQVKENLHRAIVAGNHTIVPEG